MSARILAASTFRIPHCYHDLILYHFCSVKSSPFEKIMFFSQKSFLPRAESIKTYLWILFYGVFLLGFLRIFDRRFLFSKSKSLLWYSTKSENNGIIFAFPPNNSAFCRLYGWKHWSIAWRTHEKNETCWIILTKNCLRNFLAFAMPAPATATRPRSYVRTSLTLW